MNRYYKAGFTLIELIIVIAIVSILVTIAVPSYTEFVKQSRRDDGRHLLMLNAQRLQRCFTLEGVYNGSCITRTDSEENYYTLSASSQITAASFNLIVQPVAGSSQATDNDCATFRYDNTGSRGALDSTGAETDQCW